MLVTDSQLESGVQAALQDEFEKSAEATNTGDFDYLVKNLADLANKRAIYATVFDTQEALYNPEKSARDIASEMTSAITKLEHDDVMSELNMGVEYNELAEQILHETLFGDNTKNRIPSGFKSFDTESLGFQRGNLVCLGATSGSGKSQMALNLMTRQYLMGYDVVMASYEMGYEEIMHREFALISEVAHKKIKSQKMTAEEKRIVECSFREFNLKGKKNGNGFWLACPNSQNTVTEIGMRYMTRKPTCIIFDYINLLKSSHSKQTDAQWQMLGDIAKEAKVLARRMNCVVYLLIQIDKEHNLRYSQAIKDHADWIWGWVYDEDAKMNGFVNVKQIKARSAACYDFQLVTRFDVSQFRDPEEEDKKLSYTEAQYQAILAESRQYGSLFDLFKESVTVPKPINLNAKFPVDLTAKSPVDISGVRKTPARSYVSEDA